MRYHSPTVSICMHILPVLELVTKSQNLHSELLSNPFITPCSYLHSAFRLICCWVFPLPYEILTASHSSAADGGVAPLQVALIYYFLSVKKLILFIIVVVLLRCNSHHRTLPDPYIIPKWDVRVSVSIQITINVLQTPLTNAHPLLLWQ